MKKLFLFCISVLVLSACEGDRGPQGPPGFDGQDGLIGTTQEYTNVNLNYNGQTGTYGTFLNLPFEILNSDAVLVYRLENRDNDGNPIWTQLPHNFFLNDGNIIQYVFNHTFYDVQIIIDANFDPGQFTDQEYNLYTRNQSFRAVIVPSDFANDPTNNIETFEALQQSIQKQGFQLKTISIEK
ncbi:hypothetical protein [Mesonia maritima]|uniref:Collagen-like protein n=1 Tax=Mesonia maritima TaxID=1793873 RepID=A0ABU1K471_9FLAO|nr:hypothetical protein [Mesonia maritima]MDR6300393.1 hypothetical protein [Mesonia maritima]